MWACYVFLALTGLFRAKAEQLEPQYAVSLYLASTNLSQWSTVDEAFRTELASRTEGFCSLSLEDCNINATASLSLAKDDVVYFTGFPAETDDNLRIVFGVAIASEQAVSLPAFVPQSQLASIVLIHQLSLQTAAGNLIGLVSLYSQEAPSPTPTTAPEPSLETAIENAILIILTQASLSEWQEGDLEELFREAVAEVANDHCTTSPASCSIDSESINSRRRRSNDVIFDESNTYIIPDYPIALGSSQMEIAFAVTIPFSLTLVPGETDYFVPQSTLLSLGLNLSPLLAESTGAYVIGISAYQPREDQSPASLWSQIRVGVTVPSVILILLLLGIPTGVLVFWLRQRKRKDVYNVHNYVGGVGKEVEMVRHRHLRGVYSPEGSEVDQDSHSKGESVGDGESWEDSEERHSSHEGVTYYSAQDMLEQARAVECETTFSGPVNTDHSLQ